MAEQARTRAEKKIFTNFGAWHPDFKGSSLAWQSFMRGPAGIGVEGGVLLEAAPSLFLFALPCSSLLASLPPSCSPTTPHHNAVPHSPGHTLSFLPHPSRHCMHDLADPGSGRPSAAKVPRGNDTVGYKLEGYPAKSLALRYTWQGRQAGLFPPPCHHRATVTLDSVEKRHSNNYDASLSSDRSNARPCVRSVVHSHTHESFFRCFSPVRAAVLVGTRPSKDVRRGGVQKC